MLKNYHRITVLMLLLIYSVVSFAQMPTSDRDRPRGYFKEQRKLKNWWDQPAVAATLKLEAEQLARLTKLQQDFSKGYKANATALKEQDKLLGAAIVAGDDKKVAEIRKNILDMVSTNATSQLEFKITGLAVLNEQQLTDLATAYPEVLDKRWGVRTKGMTKGNRSGKGKKKANYTIVERADKDKTDTDKTDKE